MLTISGGAFAINKAAPAPTTPQKKTTLCYMRVEGEKNTDTNYVSLEIADTVVTGKYVITYQGGRTYGDLKGSIKGNIVTANWNFVNGREYYSIPVAFKIDRSAILQKPTAVMNGKAYIPEDGDYNVEYKKVDCSKVSY